MDHFSLGETCPHVAAILFKVEASNRLELGKSSCTSLPCVGIKFVLIRFGLQQ